MVRVEIGVLVTANANTLPSQSLARKRNLNYFSDTISSQRVIRDPVSGSPFEFDAAKRILTAPPATADLNMIEPPALPW
jgi:hypothetical protein